jgi:NAD(P)H-hydrate epimerase
VDALLGTGATGAPKDAVAALLDRLHDLPLPIVALDGPTGLDLGTGLLHGAPNAELTITFGGLRRGQLLARDEVGDLVVIDIGHPPADPTLPTLVTDEQAAEWLPRFRANAHKGDRGRVVCIGGAPGMTGALRLSARAAFAAGAGLLFTLSGAESAKLIAEAEPDVQARGWDGKVEGEELSALLGKSDALVIGPGLGRSPEARTSIASVLASSSGALVLDADALNACAGAVPELKKLIAGRRAVLTPHLGEFRTLFPALAAAAEQDPWGAAAAAAEQVGAVVLLKGVPTVIADPEGTVLTIAAGNPGLATGGSGDVLSGLIGAFLAAGLAPLRATALGAQALGRAADLAARRTSARSMRPMDVVAALPDLWRAWELRGAARATPRAPVLVELERPKAS